MRITVLNGTDVAGCTYQIKEGFLGPLRNSHEIVEFYPKDMPQFCRGCKICFLKDAALCPSADKVMPIWQAMMAADLIVVAAPVYGLGIPAALKALLDHLCVRWMVHRPEEDMFTKRAVVITNSIGPPFLAKSAQRDVVNTLSWLGISGIKRLGIGLMEGVIWEELSLKRREDILKKAKNVGGKCTAIRPAGKSVKTRLRFLMCAKMQKSVLKKHKVPTADNLHWIERGWIKSGDWV